MRRYLCLVRLVSVCAVMLVPFLAAAQVGIEPRRSGAVGFAVAAGPDFVASPGFVDDSSGNGDGVANPGEGLRVTFSLRNSGLSATQDVRVVVDSDDPRVDVGSVSGGALFWAVGDVWTYRVSMPISVSATSGDVISVVTVTAADGGPWHFILTFPIVAPSVRFVREDTTVSDPAPTGDGDGLAEPGERLLVSVRLRNDGSETATNARVALATLDVGVTVVLGEATHAVWPAGEARSTDFLLDIDGAFTGGELLLFFTVAADGVVPAQFSHTIAIDGPEPDFGLRNAWIYDPAPGGNRDGRAAPGERVLPRVRLKNIGTGDARNVVVAIAVVDPDITVVMGSTAYSEWTAGQARTIGGPSFDVSPGATPHDFTATVTVTADGAGPWQFAIPFTIAEPDVTFVLVSSWVFDPEPGGNRDRQANRGERVLPRARVRNTGSDDAQGVSVVLSTDDPDITVISSTVSYDRWGAGAAHNNTGFVLDISPDAEPHDATLTATVTTAHGGPWEFTVVMPIANSAVHFVQRSSWMFDPAPGGDRDGQVEAGELVFPRLRMRHVGSEQARNVRVAITTDDPDITATTGEVTHATWAVGEARNNLGFALQVASDAGPRQVTMTIDVTADNGGPWRFTHAFEIVAPPVLLVQQTFAFDPVQAGESTTPVIRIKHIGSEEVRDVRMTLVAVDPEVDVPAGLATRDTWGPGESWVVRGLSLLATSEALPHTAAISALVTAAEGGTWRFEFELPITRNLSFGRASLLLLDNAPGGDGDRIAEPGERSVFRIKFTTRRLNFVARDVRATLVIDDADVTVINGTSVVDELPVRKTLVLRDFLIEVAPNATAHDVEAKITLATDYSDTVSKNIIFQIVTTPPKFSLRNAWVYDPEPTANHDASANPGERVYPRVRVKNTGQEGATNVRTTLFVDDADVTVVSGFVTHATWPGGEARNNNGFVLDIASDATAHDVTAVVVVSADGHGPWQFTVTIPIVVPAAATTALFANYPNPFNPETWIPFDLAEDADVTVHIYDLAGRSVRRLDLGRRGPGSYRGRTDAAYWDGRDDFGESVSSGMYIYELRAGSSRQARRMVIRK